MVKTVNEQSGSRHDTREVLIEAGLKAMFEKGYTNTGIQEVLSNAGVPKGSFYHYFGSKEDFARSIIEHFDRQQFDWLRAILRNPELEPIDRLLCYCDEKKKQIESWQCRKGCLIGILSQEMADQSETLRCVLSRIMNNWVDLFAECIAEGQKRNQIRRSPEARLLAELFLDSWDGAVLRAKTTKSLKPIDSFIEGMFKHILLPID